MEFPHIPVLVDEVVRLLEPEREGVFVDGTAGSGGHSEAIGRRLSQEGLLLCLDRDEAALGFSKRRLAFLAERVRIVKASYSDLDRVLPDQGLEMAQGVILDLGMSSYQLDSSGRGFSFEKDEPLDMRMDTDEEATAATLVNDLSPGEIEDILRKYGEEKRAKAIARAIVRAVSYTHLTLPTN